MEWNGTCESLRKEFYRAMNFAGSQRSHSSPRAGTDTGLLFLRALFFYPIHHIGFVYSQNFSHAAAADSAVVHFDCQFSGFFRVRMTFRFYRVIFTALLTLAALTPRAVVPCLNLVLDFSASRAFLPCLFCSFSHKIFILDTPIFMGSVLPRIL